MNNIKNNPLKYIKLFSIIFLVSSLVLRIILTFLQSGEINFQFIIPTFLVTLLSYIPFILFMVYIFTCYSKNKNHILLTISYIILALINLSSVISNFSSIASLKYLLYNPSNQIIYYFTRQILSVVFSIIVLAFTIFYVADCISKFKHLKTSQKLITLQLILTAINNLASTILIVIMGNTPPFTIIFSFLTGLMGLLSPLSYYIFWKYGVSATSATPTENALYAIKKQFDSGIITEEEYNQKKTEILNNF
ncbi:MAG: SHOCT domain-containing protein [Clostridia bacterium]|nr:SHOCT domain-containing protein [Clostridia bacterium]